MRTMLPFHPPVDPDELAALIVLEYITKQEFYKREKPDLNSANNKIGVEVTRAYLPEYEQHNGKIISDELKCITRTTPQVYSSTASITKELERIGDRDVYGRLTDDQIKTIVWFYKTVCQLTNVKTVDNMFIYAVCDTPEIANAVVQARIELGTQLGNLKAVASGRKTYIMAPGMTKAIAVNKMKNNYDVLIAAGDSELDIPMLLQCDHAIVPNEEMRSRLMYEATNGIWNGTPYRVKNIHCYQGGSMTFHEYVIHETRDVAYSED